MTFRDLLETMVQDVIALGSVPALVDRAEYEIGHVGEQTVPLTVILTRGFLRRSAGRDLMRPRSVRRPLLILFAVFALVLHLHRPVRRRPGYWGTWRRRMSPSDPRGS